MLPEICLRKPPTSLRFPNGEHAHRKHHLPPSIQNTYTKNGFVYANRKIFTANPIPFRPTIRYNVNYPQSDILKGV